MVHLHVRSYYSLLTSTLSINQIVQLVKNNNMNSVALVDYKVMHGAMEFYLACKKENIKPIFGLEFEFDYNEQEISCVLYALNDNGFKNLMKISSLLCSTESVLTFEQFQTLKKDCYVVLYSEGGVFEKWLNFEEYDNAISYANELKGAIGEFDIALSYQDFAYWKQRNTLFKEKCKESGIKTVAINKIYYEKEDDYVIHRILLGIKLQKTTSEQSLLAVMGRYFRSSKDMSSLYDEDDLNRTLEIADKCNVNLEFEKAILPVFKCPSNLDSKTYLTNLSMAGLKKRMQNTRVPKEYVERLRYELDVIISMGFQDYFLIIWDVIRYARSQGIYVGPGRGSAAGSLVSYCLGITHIDPIEYDLLFERFLNPERISMPDIDTDFPDNKREEVINYVINKYGQDHVAHISTFGTLGAKQVIRDVARVLDIPVREVDIISKAIPFSVKMTLGDAMKQSDRFRQIIESNPKYQELYSYAKRLEGIPRHISTHAAGIVFSDKPISEVVPCIQVETDTVSTQYTMEYLEKLGLIKMDFLGLRNLTIIDEIVDDLKLTNKDFNIMRIPMDDKLTFECIRKVDTLGIFQLESEGMKNTLRKMQPKNFDDIVATIALFRPGPMENIPLYLENKKHPEKIEILHPVLEPIVKPTYGVLVYQEQIMRVAQVMADFSLGKADILRKAMSKKVESELMNLQEDFISGCLENGYDEKLASEVYQLVLKFANYGFNKAHSVAYGMIAYQMAYLKANYPLQFYKSLLNSVIGAENKTSQYIDECRRRNVVILPPSVNHSSSVYEIENNQIRFPLSAIQNIGSVGLKEILKCRERFIEFTGFYDFVAKVQTVKVNRKMIESLIDAGALDEFKMNRKSMKASLDEALNYANLIVIEKDGEKTLNFDLVSEPIVTSLKENLLERADLEKQALGFYLSSHPIITIKRQNNINTETLSLLMRKTGFIKGFALIVRVKQHRTKKGDMMAFVQAMDESGNYDLVVMPQEYQRYQALLVKGNYILFEGKKDREDSCIIKTCTQINV